MKSRMILKSLVVVGLLTSGAFANTDPGKLTKPSEKVQSLINKFKLQTVDYNYVKKAIGKGTRKAASAVLIDARPESKYKKSTIPSSLNIPDTKYEKFKNVLNDTPKTKELIVYCGGYKCGKSPKLANMLLKDGFKNVKIYPGGEPEWIKKSYKEVDLAVVKAVQSKNSGLLVDARPYKKFLSETIPGSIAIPDTNLEELKGRFPANYSEKIIIYCGGYACGKSHKVAKKLVGMGYKDVNVFAGGMPSWKKAGLSTTKSASKKPEITETKTAKFSKNGLKLGPDEGTVDGEWFAKLLKEDKVPSYVQIVDVTSKEEFKAGHLKGAINIEAEKLTAKEFLAKLPKDKTVVFNCTAGGRSTEAWAKLSDEKYDVSEIYYFDANIDCKGNDCKIEANEPLE